MSRSAKHRTVTYEISCFVWSEGEFAGLALGKLRVQIKLLELQPVIHVVARQYEDDRLPLFQSYL